MLKVFNYPELEKEVEIVMKQYKVPERKREKVKLYVSNGLYKKLESLLRNEINLCHNKK